MVLLEYIGALKRSKQSGSKFHAAGDWYKVDCEVNGPRFVHMIQHQLIPDIQRTILGYDSVYVQMDGAKAHVKGWDEIEKLCERRSQLMDPITHRMTWISSMVTSIS